MPALGSLPAALIAALLSACAASSPEVAPPTLGLSEADRFEAAPADAPHPSPEDLRWWRRFDDPAMSYWVERALAGNSDIAIARERSREARAFLQQARSQRGPAALAQTQAGLGSRSNDGARARKLSATLAFDWDTDLWGGLRLTEQSAAAAVMQSRDLAQAARLAAAGLAARAVIEWREAAADADLLHDALAVQRQVLDVAQVRVQAGISPRLDVERARAEVAGVEAEAARAATRIRLSTATLQVLAGERPGSPLPRADAVTRSRSKADLPATAATAATAATIAPLPVLRGALPVSRPLDLLRMRPDLRAAEQALLVAAADVGVARSALLPRLRLPGTLALVSGDGLLDVFSAGIAAAVDAVIYDGGLRQAGIEIAEARLREAALVYRQTLLEALQQVESALVSAQGTRAEIEALTTGFVAAQAAVEQARTLYAAGLSGLLDLLDARRTALSQRRQLVNAQADAARHAVAGFEAMGLIDAMGPVAFLRSDR